MEGLLTFSTNRGRYAIGSPDGPDLTGNTPVEICIAGQWIAGSIEHTGHLYAVNDSTHRDMAGYYFVADDGSRCGLCVGMEVRLL